MATADKWRERLRKAQEHYTQASAIAAKIQNEPSHTGLDEALRAERQARDEYLRVLRIVTRVMDGEEP